jgi:large subunit ribosomal protein L25
MSAKIKFEVEATLRNEMGKGASRRLRREDKVPGIVYGGGKDPVSLTMEHNKISKSLQAEAFYSHILTLKINNEPERVILKDVQRHPFKAKITHVDFQRVRADQKLHMHVPLHFVGAENCPGVKEGGLISHILSDVEISCLPDKLPEYIEVDVSNLALNQLIHLSELNVPEGVELVALSHEDDKPVVSVHIPRVEAEPEPEVAAEGEEVSAAEVPATAQKAEDADEGKDAKE